MSAARWVARAGVLAGGAVATAAFGRYAATRGTRREDALLDEPFGERRDPSLVVTADDGVELYVEVAEPSDPSDAAAATVVYIPGFCLPMDAWHFQRRDLTGSHRSVFYDQRGHGRSGRGEAANATIEQLAADLHAVLAATAPQGPVVLVGHSLGGMVVMAYAGLHPELFGERIVGAALIATSPGKLAEMTLGLPAAVMRRVWPMAPAVVGRVATEPAVVQRGMRADRDVGLLLTRRFSFGTKTVSPTLVRFAGELLSSTPLDVFAEFFTEFDRHDKEAALPVLRSCQTLIVGAGRDVLTAADHSRAMAAVVPEAELLVVSAAGHLVHLECPDEVNGALRRLLERVRLAAEAPAAAAQPAGGPGNGGQGKGGRRTRRRVAAEPS